MKYILLLVLSCCAFGQTITPTTVQQPGHPGTRVMNISERDLWILQLNTFEMASEINRCNGIDGRPREICQNLFRLEAEPGFDSESIRFHVYYKDDSGIAPADLEIAFLGLLFRPKFPKWMKLERRDNGGGVKAIL